jgi:hypothetical protein
MLDAETTLKKIDKDDITSTSFDCVFKWMLKGNVGAIFIADIC